VLQLFSAAVLQLKKKRIAQSEKRKKCCSAAVKEEAEKGKEPKERYFRQNCRISF